MSSSDINFYFVLEVAIEKAYSNSVFEKQRHDEFMNPIVQELFLEGGYTDIYSETFAQLTIRRLRDEILSIDEEVKDFLSKVPDSMATSFYIWGPGGKYYFTQQQWETAKEMIRSIAISDKVILFFNLSSEFLKPRTAKVLSNEIYADKYSGKAGENWTAQNIPYDKRIQILWRCGILNDETKEKIEEVRNIRNELIHDLGTTHTRHSTDDLLSKVENTLDVLETFDRKLGYPTILTDDPTEELNKQLGIDIDSLYRELESGSKIESIESLDLLDEELIKGAFKADTERSIVIDAISDQMKNNEEMQLNSYKRYHEDMLEDISSKDEWLTHFFAYMMIFRDELGINLLKTLEQNQRRFSEDHFPKGLFTESNIQYFEPDSEE